MVALVAAVAQQHAARVGAAAAGAAAGVQHAGGPRHAAVQRQQVQRQRREAAALQQRLLPALQRLQLQRPVARLALLALLLVQP